MRVALVSEGWAPEVSGVTVAAAQHLRWLAARGHELLLIHPAYPPEVAATMGHADAPEPPARRVTFHSDPLVPYRPESRVPSPRGADEVDAAIEGFRPDVVLYKNPDRLVPELARIWRPRRVAGLRGAARVGAIAVPIVHTLMPRFAERSGAWIWRTRLAAAVTRRIWSGIHNQNFPFAVTVDETSAGYLREVGFRIPILAGPWNGVDPLIFPTRPARAPGAVRQVCWIGRLVREKNAHRLPELARALQQVGAALTVVGDGPLRAEIEAGLRGVAGARLLGWLDPAGVAAALRDSDVYLSLSETESYSLTASEAITSGVPVVAPRLLGFERLEGAGVGVLFPPAWLSAADGIGRVAAAVAALEVGAASARCRDLAPRLTWDVALAAMYGAIGERIGRTFA